ncbi:DUF4398 domain-containing protein [Alkalilimnicola sp. S0819]|uniref:DUF4398 domain-containing protein n=1 Tax=Alkalilimnicola sp. S0819 TaxID=2613922 RepID=UPI001261B983|nr:DUF4398 domain-containing protein [Alkalilimnicola sp. S0819]KAB7622573.1 DUF4398 domain-containing protein [Alkalilimnicola sp. S0819]MPQ17461.1 DUF4398 domain-containing protein [Alkalilimnicola sp. S0819]
MRRLPTHRLSGKHLLMLPATLGLLAACASTPPPTGELAQADSAVERAEQAGAVEYAPLALREARNKLRTARDAMTEKKHTRARRLAEQATADAEYAEAEARAEHTEALAAENLSSLDTLRDELQRREDRS